MTLPSTGAAASVPDDDAATLLRLACGLHTARGDAAAWRAAVDACRDWFDCHEVLDLPTGDLPLGPDEIDALAGRVGHCAGHGLGNCAASGDERKRQRCAALASHLHEAAYAARKALQSGFFDQLPAIWIVDRGGRVRIANRRAREELAAGRCMKLVDGRLSPVLAGAAGNWRRLLDELDGETRFAWPRADGGETVLRLRLLPAGTGISVGLVPEPPATGELVPILADRLGLTIRQAELAAHLLEARTLTDAARQMGISRHTANEHLAALLRRVGAADRSALLLVLRRALHDGNASEPDCRVF